MLLWKQPNVEGINPRDVLRTFSRTLCAAKPVAASGGHRCVWRSALLICYIDEAGNIGTYNPLDPSSTPVFIVGGFSVDDKECDALLMDFIHLKTELNPPLRSLRLSDVIRHEIKGATLRANVRTGSTKQSRRWSISYMSRVISLLDEHDCHIFGNVLVKKAAEVYGSASVYPKAVAELATTFNHQAEAYGTKGLMILDAQTKVKNEGNVHTITTRRFRHGGNSYPQLVESPVFGHSDTHVLLQIADIIMSSLVYMCTCAAFLPIELGNPHLDPEYAMIYRQFSQRLEKLEYKYTDESGYRRGGFYIMDHLTGNKSRNLFGREVKQGFCDR